MATDDDHHGHREADRQDAEAHLAVLLGAFDSAGAGTVGGAPAQLLAPAALE